MNQPFLNKHALITGGSRGIGKATALKLAKSGCDVFLTYYNSSDEADAIVSEVNALGRRACRMQVNVADLDSIKMLLQAVQNEFSTLDFIISNAASGVLKPALTMSTKHWRWCMETNALALNHLASESMRMNLLNSGGRILALSSWGAHRAIPNYAFIGASKAALEALVRSLSLELAPHGISINTISAGVVDTDALKYFPNREQLLDEYQAHALSERRLSVEDVANSVYLLCLPEAEMIKGQTIVVDAGYSIVG